MLNVSIGYDQSVQSVTRAICGSAVVFWMVKSVVSAVVCGVRKSTSKYGRSSVAAGSSETSHESSLSVVVGFRVADVAAAAETARREARIVAIINRMAFTVSDSARGR